MSKNPVVVERIFDAPIEAVWKALTDRDQMKQWYFDIREFRPEVGFEFQFSGGTDQKQYLHFCKILEVVPLKKLKHSWRYEEYVGNSTVTFQLISEGAKTKIRLTHEGLETFPADNSDFARENFQEGWTAIIGSTLKDFLEKGKQ